MSDLSAALSLAASQMGLNERDQRAALQDYLSTGGANLDPAVNAWCAAFVNSTLGQTGFQGTGSNMARSFLDWGQGVDQPQEGDIAVFSRGDPSGPQGHVGFFKGYDEQGNILVLGGNQGDAVSVSAYSPDRLLGFRRAEGAGQAAEGMESPSINRDEALMSALEMISQGSPEYCPAGYYYSVVSQSCVPIEALASSQRPRPAPERGAALQRFGLPSLI